MKNYTPRSLRFAARRSSTWILLATAGLLTISACSDDVQADQCPPGEQLNPIQNICTPVVCPAGTQLSPITQQCTARPDQFDAGGDLDATGNDSRNPNTDSGNPNTDSGNPNTDSGNPNNPDTHIPDPGTPGNPYQP